MGTSDNIIDPDLVPGNIKTGIDIFGVVGVFWWGWGISTSYDIVAWDQHQTNDKRSFTARTWMVADTGTYYYFFHVWESRDWAPPNRTTDIFVSKIKIADWTFTPNLTRLDIWFYAVTTDKSITQIEFDWAILQLTLADATTQNFNTLTDTRGWAFIGWPVVSSLNIVYVWLTLTPDVIAHSEWWFPVINVA